MRIPHVAALALCTVAALAAPALARKAAAGQPAFKAGDPEAYFLWHDATGWHLRVTTGPGKKKHKFHGVIRGEGIADPKATTKALGPHIAHAPTVVRFEFEAAEGTEGFDWKASSSCVTPELKIDDQALPEKIHVGAKSETPSAMPFDACDGG
jgi:hypothetical protein